MTKAPTWRNVYNKRPELHFEGKILVVIRTVTMKITNILMRYSLYVIIKKLDTSCQY